MEAEMTSFLEIEARATASTISRTQSIPSHVICGRALAIARRPFSCSDLNRRICACVCVGARGQPGCEPKGTKPKTSTPLFNLQKQTIITYIYNH